MVKHAKLAVSACSNSLHFQSQLCRFRAAQVLKYRRALIGASAHSIQFSLGPMALELDTCFGTRLRFGLRTGDLPLRSSVTSSNAPLPHSVHLLHVTSEASSRRQALRVKATGAAARGHAIRESTVLTYTGRGGRGRRQVNLAGVNLAAGNMAAGPRNSVETAVGSFAEGPQSCSSLRCRSLRRGDPTATRAVMKVKLVSGSEGRLNSDTFNGIISPRTSLTNTFDADQHLIPKEATKQT